MIIKKETKFKVILILLLFVLSLIGGALVSNFLVCTLKQGTSYQSIFSVAFFLGNIKTDKLHLLLFIILSGIIFLGFCYVCFYKRNIAEKNVGLMKITPTISIPLPAGNNQYGSAHFAIEKEQTNYHCAVLDLNDPLIKALLSMGEEDYQAVKKQIKKEVPVVTFPFAYKPYGTLPIEYKKKTHKELIKTIYGDVHTVIFGATRCGKTRTLVIQSICLQALSGYDTVNSDPKGELYLYTVFFLKHLGHKVFALDFKDPEKSCHYNFLQFIIDAVNGGNISKAIQCCWDFVECIVPEAKQTTEPLWTNGEKALMAAAVMQVVYDNSPLGLPQQYPYASAEEIARLYDTKHKNYQNCTNLFHYLSKLSEYNPQTKTTLLENIISVLPQEHPSKLILAIPESAPDRMRGSFITSALTTLRLFTDPSIAELTRYTDEGFLDTNNSKHLFLIVPDQKETYYPLVSLFTAQYYQYLAERADERGGRLIRDVKFNLDEFGNFTRIPAFDVKMTVGAGRGIHFNLYLQSQAQLVAKYGREITPIILDSCHYWIYLKSKQETAELISKRLGKYTVMTVSSSASLNDNGGFTLPTNSGSTSSSTQLIGRELLTADEIQRLERPYLLVIDDNNLPSILVSPDLHKWTFNKMLGLGDSEHNRIVREVRQQARSSHTIGALSIWDFSSYVAMLCSQQIGNQPLMEEEDFMAKVALAFQDKD